MRHHATLALSLLIALAGVSAHASAVGRPVGGSAELYGSELPANQVLPSRGIDLPVDLSTSGSNRAYTLAPQVQAIPTATAFQAGTFALSAVVLVRVLSRRRRGRSTVS